MTSCKDGVCQRIGTPTLELTPSVTPSSLGSPLPVWPRCPGQAVGLPRASRRFVKSFPCETTGFEIETEITVAALELGLPIAEVPASYRQRPAGSSSKLTALGDGARILTTIARLVRQGRPLLFFGAVAFVLTGLALALGVPILRRTCGSTRCPSFRPQS